MNVTAILTHACNMSCSYCFERSHGLRGEMSEETALRLCEFAYSGEGKSNGISFFGGEPLLRYDLIEKMINRCSELGRFDYCITTNGTLINERFIELAKKHNIEVALSHDGVANDICRCFHDGSGTAAALEYAISSVGALRRSVAMLTTTPDTVVRLCESVVSLWDRGMRKVLISPDGRPDIWDDDSMAVFDEQYRLLLDEYCTRLLTGDEVRLPMIDIIISDRVRGEHRCNNCRIGYKQPIIDTGGSIYPCIQFTGLAEYKIGNIFCGFDEEKRQEHYVNSIKQIESCIGCGIADRCKNSCPCTNFEQTGSMNTVSAFTCTYQRMLITRADIFAESLYSADSKRFMQIYGKDKDAY